MVKKVLLTATVQSHICQFHRPLVDMLHQHGCEVHAAARDNLAEKNGLKLDFVDRVFDVPFSRSPKSPENIKAYKQLKHIISDEHYDVIHCNTPMGGVVTRLAARSARKNGTRVFYTAHGFHFYQGAPKKNWLIYYPVEKLLSRYTDKLITITMEDDALARERFHCKVCHIHGVGANSKKYYPIGAEEQNIRKAKMGLSGKVILNVGELLPNKNQKTAIRAMKSILPSIPDAHLLIAGNGPEKPNLERLIAEEGLGEHVMLLGYTTQLEEYMQVCDVEIACSYREGMPLNVIEAMLCGKPVVASQNRGHKELIQEGVNGFLVAPEEDQAFAQRICELLQQNNRKPEIIADSIQSYTDTHVFQELQKIYEL